MADTKAKQGGLNSVSGRLWLDKAGESYLGHGRIELLRRIEETGSISAAARAMGMSYKAAWQAVDSMNNLADAPLVERSIGGRHGGGTTLTQEGREAVAMFEQVELEYRRFLERLSEGVADFARFDQLMRRFSMRSSARNQYVGTVIQVTRGAVNGEVVLDIGEGQRIVAIITNESIEDLKLQTGREAFALIKASAPILVLQEEMPRNSARNCLCGEVIACTEGAVNAEVGLALPGDKLLSAIVTNESIRSMGLKEGVKACALIKASNVILAVND